MTAAPPVRAEPESAPAVALREFWRERDARKWGPAHQVLSKDSRAALPEKQLAEEAASDAPTLGSGPAWAALFTRAVSTEAQSLPTVEEGSGARVEVRTPGGPGVVRMIREAGAWKIDLLKTLSSGS